MCIFGVRDQLSIMKLWVTSAALRGNAGTFTFSVCIPAQELNYIMQLCITRYLIYSMPQTGR